MRCMESESIFSDENTCELWCWLIPSHTVQRVNPETLSSPASASPAGFYHLCERRLEYTLANIINLCSATL